MFRSLVAVTGGYGPYSMRYEAHTGELGRARTNMSPPSSGSAHPHVHGHARDHSRPRCGDVSTKCRIVEFAPQRATRVQQGAAESASCKGMLAKALGALSFSTLALLVTFQATGCGGSGSADPSPASSGPGARALAPDDPTCERDQECSAGESCLDGVCQLQRCGTQPYRSVAPLGRRSYLANRRELVVASNVGGRIVDGYQVRGSGFVHGTDLRWSLAGGSDVLDVAGGDVTGARPESIVAIVAGEKKVRVLSGKAGRNDVVLDFAPVAVATGDLDGDAVAEIVAIGAAGEYAVCRVPTQICVTRKLVGVTGKDVTVADTDGDGFGEAIMLVDDASGASRLVTYNENGASNGQQAEITTQTDATFARISAGALGGEGGREVVAIEAGTLHRFAQKDAALAPLGTLPIADDILDVQVGDLDGDGRSEVVLLEQSGVEVLDGNDYRSLYKTQLGATDAPSRVALSDVNGDSPVGVLEGEVALVPGPMVPLAVLAYPPYSRTYSDGTSSIGIGNSETQGEASTRSVALSAYAMIGLEAGIANVVKGGIYAKVSGEISRSQTTSQSISISDVFSISAKPELEGPDNGVVMLGCGCYHAYTYRIEDPAGVFEGSNDHALSMFVPVGGQTTVWSIKRYNAIAAKVGGLPNLSVSSAVGDPASYSSSPVSLDSTPIPAEDFLFATSKSYRVSDSADVGWQLSMSNGASRTDAASVTVSLAGRIGVGVVVAEIGVAASAGVAYEVQVDKSASFGGMVPPIRNNARTPEDEYALHAYGFAPIMYRARYQDESGQTAGYYVIDYTVSP